MTKTKVKIDTKGIGERIYINLFEEQKKRLIEYAEETINEMGRTHTFRNRTINLEDSLVWGVFFKGEMIAHGFYGEKKAQKPARYHKQYVNGRELAEAFINSYKSQSTGGYYYWEVVWGAIAPYSVYLDPFSNRNTRSNHFYVISQCYDEIKADLRPMKVEFRTNA